MTGHTSKLHAYKLVIRHEWSRDVDGRIAPPDRSGHWFYTDRWADWTCWRCITLEPAP
jgi:hypothetical protein